MLKLITGFLGSTWGIAAAGLLAVGLGFGVGWTLQSWRLTAGILEIQLEYDQYKLHVLESVNKENLIVAGDIQKLQTLLQRTQIAQRKQDLKYLQTSENLIKELRNAGQSCPLSPAVERYLDNVRRQQDEQRNR